MKSKNIILLIAGISGASLISTTEIATAQTAPTRTPINIKVNCRNPQTQFEMNFCAAEDAKVADRKLNETYQKAISTLKGTPGESQLVDAQLAWIKFRDADCAFARDRFKGGSMAPLIYSGCTNQHSQQRTKQLQEYLTEGGV